MRLSLKEVYSSEKPQYLVGITYEIWDDQNYENNIPKEKGWELEFTPSDTQDLAMIAGNYGIEPNDSDLKTYWSNESTPLGDWMTGDEVYYQMHIKYLDGSDLNLQSREEINNVLAS